MAWLKKLTTHINVFFATLTRAEHMGPDERRQTASRIRELARMQGLNPMLSEKRPFSASMCNDVPTAGGVYHFYEGDELRYIGVADSNLQRRLFRYRKGGHNTKLAELITVGTAEVAWYTCPYPGWMEDFELIEYPHPEKLFNKQKRGNRVK